ncbi:cell division protein FtsX [Brytella acorum]|uniref:ABC3 transporter permease C-terminal domain-containing protein n=1 Tax=Brytella acorum TaxID=2959299 RepID=A0AA35Y3T3_9PROT|nr:FtsX-like permease family protein [Brytella acorum]MDF3624265.1 hypothetical protein [Brytella acorum]CAI9121161.1 hypothetical protein LMG32879_002007 [Brytella acorum]
MKTSPRIRASADGLNRHGGDRGLMAVIAAMAALATLALGGWSGATALQDHWRNALTRTIFVELSTTDPDTSAPDEATHQNADKLIEKLNGSPVIHTVKRLSRSELDALLAPWLGGGASGTLSLPTVLTVIPDRDASMDQVLHTLRDAAPDAAIEPSASWGSRLGLLATSLRISAVGVMGLALCATAGVVMLSVRMVLLSRRKTVEILHALGASDGMIAGRIARQTALMTGLGGLCGALAVWPALTVLARIMAPFGDVRLSGIAWPADAGAWMQAALGFPVPFLELAASVPFVMAFVGWIVSEFSVRLWLRRLP